ncbi:MAG: Iron-sulfur assembly protein 1 [Chrysothrix sp. TS-e1954]|nr:MAG: Iron-sulfur assembly protein 1 [Chrysothrix sp. TS-e1954]
MSLARNAPALSSFAIPLARHSPHARWRSVDSVSQSWRLTQHQSHLRLSSRRTLASAAAHRPESLDPAPPPRNADIPDTSIAGDTTSADRATQTSEDAPSSQTPDISITENEAQNTATTSNKGPATGSVATPSPSPSAPRKSKLRPRKAALSLSQTAVTALRELLNEPSPRLIRVGVKNRGCSGLAYHLEYVEKPGAFDEAVDQDGVKVLIDSKALFSIIGSEMDWVEDKLSRRFVFRNPNINYSGAVWLRGIV